MSLLRSAVKALFACVLVAALLLAQTLGMVHGVVHSSASGHAHKHSNTHAHDHAEKAAHDAVHDSVHNAAHQHDALTSLFAAHDGEKDCRLYDQASQGGMLPLVVALVCPVVPPPFEVAIFQGKALARWVALFDARGPPLTV